MKKAANFNYDNGIKTITKVMVGTENDIREITPQIVDGNLYIPFIVPHPCRNYDGSFDCNFETTMLKIDKELIKQIITE